MMIPNAPRSIDEKDPRKELEEYLLKKMESSPRQDYRAMRMASEPLTENNRNLALTRALFQGANMAGTIGGRTASSDPIEGLTSDLQRQNNSELGRMDAMRAKMDLDMKAEDDRGYQVRKYLADKRQAELDKAQLKANQAQKEKFELEKMDKAYGYKKDLADKTKLTDNMDKQVQKLSDDLEPLQDVANSILRVEEVLGSKLEDFDTSNGLKLKGKDVDLPGASLPGIGRVNWHSSDARILQGAADAVFNKELKTRSGASVTSNELERLRNEFNAGKFNTEEELIRGLRDYKKALANALQNREAGFRPEIRTEYQNRGAQDLSEFQNVKKDPPKKPETVRMIRNGRPYYIPIDEVEEALGDGFERAENE